MAVAAPASDAKPRLNVPPSMASALRLDPVGLGAGPSMPSPSRRLAEPPKTPSPSKTTYSDRFIPCRSSSRLQNFALIDSPLSPAKDDTPYSRLLRAELFGPDSPKPTTATSAASASPNTNLFRFKKDHSAPTSPFAKAAAAHHDCTAGSGDAPSPQKPPRKVPKTPHKVLDAPSLQDDFYLNLVDWSSQNVLAVGLGTCVYLWSASNSKVTKLCDLGPRDSVCAVHWSREGSYLSIGTGLGDVQIWDSSRCKRIRNMGGHQTRTGVLAWSSCILSSGSRDKNILQHDIRVPNDYISKFSGHRSEVCNLAWCKNVNELVSTHGYSQNQIMVWKYPSMSKDDRYIESGVLKTTVKVKSKQWKPFAVATLTGHTMRVLYLASSPDGQTIVTGAGDETLRFWNIFPSVRTQTPVRDIGLSSFSRSHIR
ncbi:Fizzy-related protein [Zea mays]|uniref:Fizzy-related protein n=2 Tax=Zea mays TaxID=4577 RepID=A0A1D6N090_MAIZE|nr:Fizzy-related protein [Zea mays]